MNKIKIEVAVGLLVVIGMIILGYFTILMKDEIYSDKNYYSLEVVFPSANGLKKGDNVTVLGVSSGEVFSVDLLDNEVLVKLQMFNQFKLYENYIVKIRAEGALGDKYIDIQPGYEFDENRTYTKIDMNERLVGERSGDLMAAIEDLVAKNEDALEDSLNNIRDITQNIKVITRKINNGEGTLGKLLSDDKTINEADKLISELKETVEDAREQAPVTSFIRAALTAF